MALRAGVLPRTERFTLVDRAARLLAGVSLAVAVLLAINNQLAISSPAAAASWAGHFRREDPSQTYWTAYYPLLLGAPDSSHWRSSRA